MNNDARAGDMPAVPETMTQGEAPVVISPSEIETSKRIKANKPKSLNQIPAFRAASNLLYVLTQVTLCCPKKIRIVIENLDQMGNNLLVGIALAYDDTNARVVALTEALATIKAMSVKIEIINKLGYMPKDDHRKVRALVNSLVSQIAAWRNSVLGQSSIK